MMAFAQNLAFAIPSFLVILGLVVTIHELGHFWVARWCGVAIERFSIGFGRAIFSAKDKHGIEWRVGWIPLGGYVMFAGDENASSVPDREDLAQMRADIVAREGAGAEKKYLPFKPLWQRALIVAAGPFANFILAIVIFAVMAITVGEPFTPAKVAGVSAGSAAARAGFQAGDEVTLADGRRIDSFSDLTEYVVQRDGVAINFTVLRGGRTVHVLATPDRVKIDNGLDMDMYGGRLGLEFKGATWKRWGLIDGVGHGFARTWDVLETTVHMLGRMVTGKVSAEMIGGPIQIAQISGAVAQASARAAPDLPTQLYVGLISLLNLAALISVSIGFLNLLPLPVLDGGHLLFYAYEAVARRPLAAKVQAAGYRVGLALLVCLMLFATWNDLQRLRVFQTLGGLFS